MEPTPKIRPIFYFILIATLVLMGMHIWRIYIKPINVNPQAPSPFVPIGTVLDPNRLVKEEQFEILPIKNETDYATVDLSFPRFKLLSTVENDKIENVFRIFAREHVQTSQENMTARLDTMSEEEKKTFLPMKPEDKFAAYGDAEVIQANEKFVSLLLVYGGYQGGAHGFEAVSSYNYDLKNKTQVTLASLFPEQPDVLSFVSEMSRRKLLEKLLPHLEYQKTFNELRFETEEDGDLAQMIYEGTAPTADNFSVFTFTSTDVTIYFSEYQVAPYVYGRQSVTISRSEQIPVLNPTTEAQTQ